MCLNRDRRYKLRSIFKILMRKLIKGYRDRAGCIILKQSSSSKIQVLLIDSIDPKYSKFNIWKLPGINYNLLSYSSKHYLISWWN